jgi:hypothetical protein
MTPNAGILLSTFDRHERLARWTVARIERLWLGHPPLFFSGLSVGSSDCLPFECDPRDWMGVTLSAVEALLEKAFTHAYLILDDHPPVGVCHSEFLNERLPELAGKLDAAHISLLGYGQHRKVEGSVLGKEFDYLERLDVGYRWKFSLHPGFWRLADLKFLLTERMCGYGDGSRTPWNFERHRDEFGSGVLRKLGERCYRIRGEMHDMASGICLRPLLKGARFIADVEMFLSRLAGGATARERSELERFWMYGYFGGPYPIFWSGCLRQGKAHADFEKWLSIFGSADLRKSWEEARNFIA